jgi:hypothetical protein
MTVATTGDGGAVVPYDPDQFGDVGLEDVGVSDVVIPRLRIVHDEAVFEDNLSKAKFDTLKVILLGLVKQRIFWHDEVDDGDVPVCKSPDFEHGFPNLDEQTKPDKRFPIAKSNFNLADFPAGGPNSIGGHVTLPCSTCIFKEWEKGDWKVPPCTEQHTFPLLYTPDDGETWTPALLSLQKTGIKPSRQYISSFAQSKTPMFTVFTELKLTPQSRGNVKYAVPTLKRLEQTEKDLWGHYADQYRGIRDFVRQPPRRDEDEAEGAAAVPTEAPAASAAAPATDTAAAAGGTATATPATEASPAPAAATTAQAPASSSPEAAAPAADADELPF